MCVQNALLEMKNRWMDLVSRRQLRRFSRLMILIVAAVNSRMTGGKCIYREVQLKPVDDRPWS
jgi:hypothetical protein